MSFIPDTRNDSNYNEDFLNADDNNFVQGYDCAVDTIVNLLAGNLDTYQQELTELCPADHIPEYDEAFATRTDLYEIVTANKEILCAIIKDWMEMERDEIITSFIDNMDDKEYEMIKENVLKRNAVSENPKEYYDTRKYAVTGKKEFAE